MLVLTRKLNEKITIGDDIVLTVIDVRSDGSVRLGIDAPRGVKIQRNEVIQAVAAANAEAAAAVDAEDQLKQVLGGLTLNKPAA